MLTSSQAVRFSAADFGKELFWESFDLFALYFLINGLGLPARTAGMVLMVTLMADALFDPAAGALFDGMRKSRASLRWIFLGMPAACAILIGIFYGYPQPAGSVGGQITAVVLIVMLFRLAYTLVDVPINAVTAYLGVCERDKSLLWGLRKGFATGAALLLSLWGTPLREALGSEAGRSGFLVPILLLCGLAWAAYAASWSALPQTWSIAPQKREGDVVSLVSALARSRRFWGMVSLLFLNACILGLMARAAIFLKPGGEGGFPAYGALLAAMVVGRIVSIPVLSLLSIRKGRRYSLWLVLAVLWLSTLGLPFATGEHVLLMLFAGNGFAVAGIALVGWSYSPDMTEDASVAAGGLVATSIGLFSTAVKVGTGLGTALLASLVSLHGGVSDGAASAAFFQTAIVFILIGTAATTALVLWLPPFRALPAVDGATMRRRRSFGLTKAELR